MSPKYTKDQPAGFVNRIEKVAIVGVSEKPSLYSKGAFSNTQSSRLLEA